MFHLLQGCESPSILAKTIWWILQAGKKILEHGKFNEIVAHKKRNKLSQPIFKIPPGRFLAPDSIFPEKAKKWVECWLLSVYIQLPDDINFFAHGTCTWVMCGSNDALKLKFRRFLSEIWAKKQIRLPCFWEGQKFDFWRPPAPMLWA